jgi:hypothetical protein
LNDTDLGDEVAKTYGKWTFWNILYFIFTTIIIFCLFILYQFLIFGGEIKFELTVSNILPAILLFIINYIIAYVIFWTFYAVTNSVNHNIVNNKNLISVMILFSASIAFIMRILQMAKLTNLQNVLFGIILGFGLPGLVLLWSDIKTSAKNSPHIDKMHITLLQYTLISTVILILISAFDLITLFNIFIDFCVINIQSALNLPTLLTAA